jgi:hypothetical protein
LLRNSELSEKDHSHVISTGVTGFSLQNVATHFGGNRAEAIGAIDPFQPCTCLPNDSAGLIKRGEGLI